MTTAIIGTGGVGSVIAGQLALGGESLRLSSADNKSAEMLASKIGPRALVAVDNRDALARCRCRRSGAAIRSAEGRDGRDRRSAERQTRCSSSNPVSVDPQGNLVHLLPKEQSSGEVVAGWLLPGRTLGDGVWIPDGRPLRVLQQPVTGVGGPLLRNRRWPCGRGS